jgi:glutamyl endopeptidase
MKKIFAALFMLSSTLLLASPDLVIGTDSRKQILSLKADPFYSSVGLLRDSDKNSYCTATLITPKHIITSGHCVVLWKDFPSPLVRVQSLTFTPGKLSEGEAPYGIYNIVRIKTFAAFTQTGNSDYDVAVLELDRSPKIPFIRLVSYSSLKSLSHKPIVITGYSSGKAPGTLWEGAGIVETFVDSQSMVHDVDTLPGTSGSLVRMKVNGSWIGVGVHRGGYLGGQTEKNRAVIFSQTVMSAIKRWIE